MNRLIAVTIGDIDGIGIHLLLNEWKKRKIKNFIIISNYKILKRKNLLLNYKINILKDNKTINNYKKDKLNILGIKTKNKYTNVIDSLETAYEYTKKGIFIGILTLPINKKEINKYSKKDFIDQTTFFSNLEKNNETNMVFIFNNKFFVPLTTHIELKNVYKYFAKKQIIYNKINSLYKTIKKDFKINKPKLIMAGINPHAGEEGIISQDENKLLKPIINKLKINKINIKGPISGDGLINKYNLNKYDVFIFTYHDQALIPFKILSNYGGVNFTSNLSIIRLSPSHGTARDLISKRFANSKGILNCFKIINKIHNNRKKID